MSALPPDKEHPFGHARGEYVAALAVAFLVIWMGVELLGLSIDEILGGENRSFSVLAVVMLSVGIVVKLGMFVYNRLLARKFSSDLMRATALDSISDVVSSAVVLASLIVARFTAFDPDGYVGCLVALLIAVSGARIFKRTASKLVGKTPDRAVTDEIRRRILSYEGVYGIHDLVVHDYVDRLFVSVHVEIDADVPVLAAHELVDTIEKDFARDSDVTLTVHVDPVVLRDGEVVSLRSRVEELITSIDPRLSVHDLREVKCDTCIKVIFEVTVPYEIKDLDSLRSAINDSLLADFSLKYSFDFTLEHSLVE